jgi:phasin family protein
MATEPFSEWKKTFAEFKSPVDIDQAAACFRRNVEAGSDFMQTLAESAQTIALRQGEFLRSNAEHAIKTSQQLMEGSAHGNGFGKQADMFKEAFERNVNHAREIAEMTTKATREAFDLVSKRISEQMKECTSATSSPPRTTKKKAA